MEKAKFVRVLGYASDVSSFLCFVIEGGQNSNSIGDQVWFSECGTEMQVYDWIESHDFNEMLSLFERDSATAIKGALRASGLDVDMLCTVKNK